jgi:hypothetical protein
MRWTRRIWIGIAAGVAVSIALNVAWEWSFRAVMDGVIIRETPYWFTNVSTLVVALGPLIPGFLAAWLSRQHGLVVGFLVGFIGTVACSVVFGTYWPDVDWSSVLSVSKTLLWLALHGVSVGLISAAAGGTAELLRSNNALEQTREG